jgi:hypothetical protein
MRSMLETPRHSARKNQSPLHPFSGLLAVSCPRIKDSRDARSGLLLVACIVATSPAPTTSPPAARPTTWCRVHRRLRRLALPTNTGSVDRELTPCIAEVAPDQRLTAYSHTEIASLLDYMGQSVVGKS